MKKSLSLISILPIFAVLLCSCGQIGDKTASVTVLYASNAILSLLLLLAYFVSVRKKDIWFSALYVAVLVVNIGYFYLSVAPDLSTALLANRIAYLGSVFLPLSIMMIILNVIGIQYKKQLPISLIAVAVVVFCIAASPGYSDIYYKEVWLHIENGVSMLEKDYGDWHFIYLVYLVCYFAAMVGSIVYSIYKKKIESPALAVIFALAVFINLGVWFIEQIIKFDFEMLSVSYIISELFLLGIYITLNSASERKSSASAEQIGTADISSESEILAERLEVFKQGIDRLTRTERVIYELYINGKTTKEVLSELNIKENTLKFHNKNLYGKLGVSSRRQLIEIHKAAKEL